MSRLLSVLIVLMVLASGAALYQFNHRVQLRVEHLDALEAQIEREAEAIRVLEAEWAYLIDPERLQQESSAHLLIRPTMTEQLVTNLSAVPFKGSDFALAMAEGSGFMPRPRPTAVPRTERAIPVAAPAQALTVQIAAAGSGRTAISTSSPTARATKVEFTRRISRILNELEEKK